MNDGIITLIAFWSTLVLLLSGWLDHLCQEEGVAKRWIYTYITLPLPFWLQQFSWSPFTVKVGSFLLPFLLLLIFLVRQEAAIRIHLIALGWLIGLLLFFLRKIVQFDPVLLMVEEKYLLMLAGGIPALLLAFHFRELLLSILLGSFLSELLYKYSIRHLDSSIVIGDAYFTDLTWLMLTFAIAFFILLTPIQRRYHKRNRISKLSGSLK